MYRKCKYVYNIYINKRYLHISSCVYIPSHISYSFLWGIASLWSAIIPIFSLSPWVPSNASAVRDPSAVGEESLSRKAMLFPRDGYASCNIQQDCILFHHPLHS